MTCRVLNTTDPTQEHIQTLTQLKEEEFLCPYTTHCLALCLCCDFLACDCQVKVFTKTYPHILRHGRKKKKGLKIINGSLKLRKHDKSLLSYQDMI